MRGWAYRCAGGTQGIGEGVALRFAQLGASRIFILGRNQALAQSVLSKLRVAALEAGHSSKSEYDFIQADLS